MNKPNDKPLVSVIIPAYNNADELKKTLETALCQTYNNFEIIVTDDGSEEDLLPVITAVNDCRISYHKIPHANANVARNFGIRKSKGSYIAMLDSGDFWRKEHLDECIGLLEASAADGLYGSLICTRGVSEQICWARELASGETMAQYLLATGSGAQTSTLFMTSDSAKDILWDDSLNRHQDYDFVLRYSKRYQWIAKSKATVIHPVIPRKDYDFDACIRFINRYKSEIDDNILTRYYRGMLLLAKSCDAPQEITTFYVKELNRLYPENLSPVPLEPVEISVIMPVCNVEKYVSESVESILRQSFPDFELIVIDRDSTDDTLALLRSFHDQRMIVLQTTSSYSESLNTGLKNAKGKYIAFMNPGDIMHIDRLKIQRAILEEEPEITVCGSWVTLFGNNTQTGRTHPCGNGLIELPLLQLLQQFFLFYSTVLLRKDFLICHHLQYEDYPDAEHSKLWFEVAKRKGIFYIESQSLLNRRMDEPQIEQGKEKIQSETKLPVQKEILNYLIEQNEAEYPEIRTIYDQFSSMEKRKLMKPDDIFSFFYTFFSKNKISLRLMEK